MSTLGPGRRTSFSLAAPEVVATNALWLRTKAEIDVNPSKQLKDECSNNAYIDGSVPPYCPSAVRHGGRARLACRA
jgi:hypothetical protein